LNYASEAAKKIGMISAALVGFTGGRIRDLADHCLHVPTHNYGVVEDIHQSIMHIIAQYLRYKNLDEKHAETRGF
jgi:D-sedoheptulose 7-phosphate isomerase